MSDRTFYIVIGFFVAASFVVDLVVSLRRHRRDHGPELAPPLAAHGLTLVAARWPGYFKVGPFPKFEAEMGRPQSKVLGVSGEYNTYRVVSVRDEQGNTHQLWAKIEFERFSLRRIRWRAEAGQNLPPEANEILET